MTSVITMKLTNAVFFEDTMPFVFRDRRSGSRQEYVELMPIGLRSDLLRSDSQLNLRV